MKGERKPNRLITEKSPYLLEHAYNPVDWYPWGDQAFQKSKAEDRPIFLSVGYSTCHWCHVLRDESFEDETIAEFMNQNFVSIKVDREERPDIDEIYMKAVTSMTGQGGWPLSVFLTPDLKPFYGGTYFPPAPRYGMPSFRQLLEFIAKLWKEKRNEVEHDADEINQLVKEAYKVVSRGSLNESLLDNGYAVLISRFDAEYGGYGAATKFPMPNFLSFLMRYFKRTGKEVALSSVTKTLQAMGAGGIHDHLGGGFHRYSTDRHWLVPHFEKMLYDNALLAKASCELYQITRDESFSEISRQTLHWMIDEMASPEGGFYSAQDADTPDGEGFYYTWTRDEILSLLGPKDGELFSYIYGVSAEGNFEGGRSILHLANSVEGARVRFGISREDITKSLTGARIRLLEARSKRRKPAIDDKVLTSWNGLAISSLAYAYQALQEDRLLVAAEKSADFVLTHMIKNGELLRRYRDGEVAIPATLEDYSLFIAGLIDLYEADLEPKWLERAEKLADRMIDLFWDSEDGGFILSLPSSALQVRVKEGYDGPIPSGNSAATLALLRLAELTGREGFRTTAEKTLRLFSDSMDSEPSAHTAMLSALSFFYGPSKEVVVAVKTLDGGARTVVREVQMRFIPNKVLCLVSEDDPARTYKSPLTEGKSTIDGLPTVYICENFACKRPTTELAVLRRELDS